MDCNSSYDQAGKDMEEQHQFPDHVQTLEIADPPLRVQNLDKPSWDRKIDTGVREQILEKSPSYHLLGEQSQLFFTEQSEKSRGPKGISSR